MRVSDKIVPLDYCLKNGDVVTHNTFRREPPVAGTPIEVLRHGDVVIANKPSTIPVHPCGAYRFNSLVRCCVAHLLHRCQANAIAPLQIMILAKEHNLPDLRITHRLDRLTSGACCAAPSTGQRALTAQRWQGW